MNLIELKRFSDERGFFSEVGRVSDYLSPLVQMNHSHSKPGVLRGLHYHLRQADLWYLIKGEAQVALADLRDRRSTIVMQTFTLAEGDPHALYIPPEVAHGYLALTEVDLLYWVSEYYDGSDEYGVAWDDPTLAIPWEVNDPILSRRDLANPSLDV